MTATFAFADFKLDTLDRPSLGPAGNPRAANTNDDDVLVEKFSMTDLR